MALKWGTTTIGSDYTVKFNGTEVKKIYWNSTLVWEKAASICSNCGGDGRVTSTCYECYTRGDGKCSNCRGKKYSTSTIKCTACLGLSSSFLCAGCGTTIYVSSFKKTGTTATIDWTKSYECGRCGKYYTNLNEVGELCENQGCTKHVEVYGYSTGACLSGYQIQSCTTCSGTGVCPFCNGEGILTTACPVCNGGGGGGGDTSSD